MRMSRSAHWRLAAFTDARLCCFAQMREREFVDWRF